MLGGAWCLQSFNWSIWLEKYACTATVCPKAWCCYCDLLLISASQSSPQHAKQATEATGKTVAPASHTVTLMHSHACALQACKNAHPAQQEHVLLLTALPWTKLPCTATCCYQKATSECCIGMPCWDVNTGTIAVFSVYLCLGSISARDNNVQMSTDDRASVYQTYVRRCTVRL